MFCSVDSQNDMVLISQHCVVFITKNAEFINVGVALLPSCQYTLSTSQDIIQIIQPLQGDPKDTHHIYNIEGCMVS